MRAFIRLRALIIKELLAVTRDPRSRFILVVPPVVQLLVFSFAATLDVKNLDVAVVNRDSGLWSRELIRRIEETPAFRSVAVLEDHNAMRRALDRQQAIAVLHIGPEFSRAIEAGRPATFQMVLDGRKSNATQIVAGYVNQIAAGLSVGPVPTETGRARGSTTVSVTVAARAWFNPNFEDTWHMVPGLVAIIALLMGLMVTALSVARERELGTFDQLMVSPFRIHEILIGKVIPPMLIGLVHITLFVFTAVFIFEIPFRGSLPVLYGAALFFLFSVVGVGLFISSISSTQQQAILGAFVFMVPAMVLSGFVTPIENMPDWLQTATFANPVRYFLVIVKGVFLKDLALDEVMRNIGPLFLIGLATTSSAAWLFRHRSA